MAYLHAHTRDLFSLVAEAATPQNIQDEAHKYSSLPLDSKIPDLAWLELCLKIEKVNFPGKKALLQEIDRQTRGGG